MNAKSGNAAGAAFSARSVSHSFYSAESQTFVKALKNLTLDVPSRHFVSLIGPSGCGKSTLLNVFAGLIKPTSGEVYFKGAPLPRPNTATGYVTQSDTLLPWRRVAGNVGVALEIRRVSRVDRQRRIGAALELVGLTDFARSFPGQLSGGMRKRVGLARVLAYEPDVYLMDEPFAALDAQLRLTMQNELLRVWERVGGTVVFVTHDIEEAVGLSDLVYVLHPRPGRLAATIEIDLPRPRNLEDLRYTPAFIDQCQRIVSVLKGETAETQDDS